jgi:hypothetical protein
MPYEISLDERLAGYALEDATGVEGHPTKIVVQEFTSSEDGELFISRLVCGAKWCGKLLWLAAASFCTS